ncbi:LptF/LptG family permease [Acaryochloris sp. IP29b_bin.137]|uniref:LptF/LptG family permease n=1 Tax=Acaryochloris sp. IP29b_bin.137 TaxID=2969217 RepID=UPI0026328A57|nr:LptF/LptG family permease [Acaryochloris sp. IP29b_bin.137]
MLLVRIRLLRAFTGLWLSRLDSFILRAFWGPWSAALGAFTALSFSIGALFDVLRRLAEGDVSGTHALQVLALQLPQFIVLSLPMSMLLATLFTYSQLAKSNELMALRACGTDLYRLIRPVFCFSLIVAVATLSMSEWVVPRATITADRLLAQHPGGVTASIPAQDMVHQTYRHHHLTQLFYAQTYDGQALHQVTILQYQNRHLRHLWLAEQARWDPPRRQWILEQGTHYTLNPKTQLYQRVVSFQRHSIQAASPQDIAMASRPTLSMGETYALLQHMQPSGDQHYRQRLQVRLHSQMAFPWVGVGFTLIGAALGNQATQKRASLGFGLSSLLIFAYYTFSFICQTLGNIGFLPAILAGWLSIASLFTLGMALLHLASRGAAHA